MRRFRIALVVASAALAVPAALSALDRSAALAGAESWIDGGQRSIDGLRRRAAASLAARRYAAAAVDARAVLARQPLDRPALRILSMAAAAQGDADLAGEVAIDASFVSWRDPYTQLRLFELTSTVGDLDDAARRADALSRIDEFRGEGFGALNALLARPGGADAVAARVATRPPWREAYFEDTRRGLAVESRQAAPLLRALGRTTAPASPAEIDQVLAFMVVGGLGAEAWAYVRANSGGAAGALIDDPDLQSARIGKADRANPPFTWSMPADTPVRLVGHRDAAGRPALRVEAPDDRSELFVSRRVIVTSGRYRLSYQASGAPDQLERLHPDLRCSGGVRLKLQPIGGPDATTLIVDIPAGCTAPKLGFTLDLGESGAPAELAIRRVMFTPL